MEQLTKICNKCGEEKSLSEYGNLKRGKFGKYPSCKLCRKAYLLTRKEIDKKNYEARVAADPEKYKEMRRKVDAKWYANNTELARERSRAYKQKNRDKCNAKTLEYKWNNIEEIRAKQREFRKLNKDKSALASARRRAAKKRAIPGWAMIPEEDAKIKAMYLECKLLSSSSGVEYNVDHIVPLTSNLVCGLHCLNNLQIVLGSINKKKNNRYWPDMP